MGLTKTCRLCGKESVIHVNIFDDSASSDSCLAKIQAVVPDVVILRYDSLPKIICYRCVGKVKDFNEFRETCIQTQKKMKQNLSWMPQKKDNNCKKNSAPAQLPNSPMITYLSGELAYPYGDPEIEILTLSDDDDNGVSNATPAKTGFRDGAPSRVPKSIPIKEKFQPNVLRAPSAPPGAQAMWIEAPAHASQTAQNQAFSSASASTSKTRVSESIPQPARPARGSQWGKPSTSALESTSICPTKQEASLPSQSSAVLNQPVVPVQLQLQPNGKRTFYCSSEDSKTTGERRRVHIPGPKCSQSSRLSCAAIATKSPVSTVVPMTKSDFTEMAIPPVPPGIPLQVPVGAGEVKNSSSDSIHPVHPKSIKKTTKRSVTESPKPKSKKKKTGISEEDRVRICQMYPNIQVLSVNGNLLLVCSLCNKFLITEDAVALHECPVSINSSTESKNHKQDPNTFIKANRPTDTNDSVIKEGRSEIRLEKRLEICKKYPKMEAVQICGDQIVLVCTVCNKILVSEDAVHKHVCKMPASLDHQNSDQSNMVTQITDTLPDNLNEQSGHSSCSSVELISVDDDIPSISSQMTQQCV